MKRLVTAIFTVLAALLVNAMPAMPVNVMPTAAMAADTVISLITCYPGSDIYELEGHAAIRVNLGYGRDYAVSYGMFDFNAPNFVYRFVKGETDYSVGVVDMGLFIESYRREGRRVTEQRLNLTSEEKSRILELLNENLRPENRVYRYNYVKDNCSTRPLAIISRALSDSVTLGPTFLDVQSMPFTFRSIMRHYHENYPWYQFGIDMALGSGIDYSLTSAEQAFAPVLLTEQIDGARRSDGRHLAAPAVALVDVPADNAVLGPTPWYLTPVAVSLYIFALLLAVTVRDVRRREVTKWVDALMFGVYGLLGLLLTFLIFVSVHEATSPNILFMWLNPLCFIPVILIWLKKCKTAVLSYQIINFAALLVLCVLFCAGYQSPNMAFWPLILGEMMRSGSYIYINKIQKPSR